MYTDFASVYDRLMNDVDYNQWADYYEKLFKHFDVSPSLVADLGCGSGSLTVLMNERGYDMIGIDSSVDMLHIAKQKNNDILFLNMDACDFELYGTVDAFISSLDLVNYVDDLEKLFALVCNYLNYGGVFIFDMSTPYKLRNILGENTFVYDEDDVFYTWENSFDGEYCNMMLSIFVDENGLYRRIDEFQTQRAVEIDEVKKAAAKAGLQVLGVFDEFTFDEPKGNSERVFFVVGRGK